VEKDDRGERLPNSAGDQNVGAARNGREKLPRNPHTGGGDRGKTFENRTSYSKETPGTGEDGGSIVNLAGGVVGAPKPVKETPHEKRTKH